MRADQKREQFAEAADALELAAPLPRLEDTGALGFGDEADIGRIDDWP
jgi:hypothetical protein